MIQMDERVLVDSFEYSEFIDVDRFNQPSFKESLKVEHVRIDRNTVFSKDTNDNKVIAEAVIFCYAGLSDPFIEFKERSKVTFDGIERTIQKVVYITEPYTELPFSYELEVM